MSTICVSSNVFIDTLNSNFKSSAAVLKHLGKMGSKAIIWSCLNCNANAFYWRDLRIADCFIDRVARVAGKGIMKISDEKVPIIFGQRHKGPTHHNVFNFIYRMTEDVKAGQASLSLVLWDHSELELPSLR